MYSAERHNPAESMVDWHAVLVIGHQVLRGSERLRAGNRPGTLAPFRKQVRGLASRTADACGELADDLRRRRVPRAVPAGTPDVHDARLVEMFDWLSGICNDLDRVGRASRGR